MSRGQSVQRQMTSSICKTLTRPLHIFSSRRHPNSVGLLEPCLSRFPALVTLDISFCNLFQIPDAIGQLYCLESLNIGGNNIVTLPHCIKELPKLRQLHLEYCNHLKWLPSILLPIGSRSFRGLYGGLYVFNCPSLIDPENCGVTVFWWMRKLIQVNIQRSSPEYNIEAVIPGMNIPRWFDKQNRGDSVSVDPSPILDDNNWIGIACCVTFVVHDTPTNPAAPIYCGFRCNGRGGIPPVPIRFKKDLITTELDHMLLKFFSREAFMRDYINDFKRGESDFHGIGLALVTSTKYPEVVEVKSCGYRWVYKEDLEQFNPTMMSTANSSAQNQKHKFLE
ncbi:hypothetical protein PIB30_073520 [Stylosanthes scabra]|uniref:C-JID domain-containing protein n=1 Tax=Stylosanthes scabra TaxID=79078 RepID=A0ABU6ZN29_9FABA|nr:hypothetical protein [Stylosanthes scabra]